MRCYAAQLGQDSFFTYDSDTILQGGYIRRPAPLEEGRKERGSKGGVVINVLPLLARLRSTRPRVSLLYEAEHPMDFPASAYASTSCARVFDVRICVWYYAVQVIIELRMTE